MLSTTYLLSLLTFLIHFIPLSLSQSSEICRLQEEDNFNKCLMRWQENKQTAYPQCKDTICYLFISEEPFVTLPTLKGVENLHEPFPCGQPERFNSTVDGSMLRGLAFELHKQTSSRDALCIYAGDVEDCTFNALVRLTAKAAEFEYQFAITGLLLETPDRQCYHEPSAPFVDNSMVIIGKKDPKLADSNGPFYQLIKPFRFATWGIFAVVIVMFIVVCFAIAVRFHVARKKSLVTAFFIFAGERDQALAYERGVVRGRLDLGGGTHSASEGNRLVREEVSFATKYGLSMTLFRTSLIAFIGVFALFYEVAVVNFVFQQARLELDKSVRNLSQNELEKYIVLEDSALESVWKKTVNPKEIRYQGIEEGKDPWKNCRTAVECADRVSDKKEGEDEINFMVTFEVVGKYLLGSMGKCGELTVFETRDVLYHFNAGWLYNDRCDQEMKKQIDRELVALRINGSIRKAVEETIEKDSCSTSVNSDIGPFIILVPVCVFVLPPLIGSVVVLLCWNVRYGESDKRENSEETSDRSSSGNGREDSSSTEIRDANFERVADIV